MKTPGDSSSASGAGKKRHKRRAHAASEGCSGPNECSGNDTCELCSPPVPSSRGSSSDKKGVHSSPLLHGHGTNAPSDPSLVTKFYCKAARLHGVLHHKLEATLSAGGADFTEDGVLLLGNQVTDIVSEALSITRGIGSLSGGGGGYSNPGNPFVMLLSILLPPLRKFLAWTWTTRSVWYGAANPSSMYQQNAVVPAPAAESTARSNASNGSSRTAVSNPVLWTMLAQHDVIARLTALLADISRLIERNEDESLNSSQGSSSLASSSAALPAPSTGGSLNALPIPQVHHIAVELEDEYSEYRVCLAELTECLVENLETIASRLCRPVMAKDASKARGSANDFIELLVLQILDPVAKRFVEAPSQSRLYLFPRLLDKCISVVIDEFILRPGGRMNEIAAAQVEKGAMFLRTWSLRVETDYNTRARALASASPDHDQAHANTGGLHRRPSMLLRGGSGDIKAQLRDTGNTPRRPESPASSAAGIKLYRANTSQDDIRGRMDARLELTTLDGFKRLDSHIKQWLRNDTAGPLPAIRSRGGNLAEGLRESIARTFTARNSGGSVRFEVERQ